MSRFEMFEGREGNRLIVNLYLGFSGSLKDSLSLTRSMFLLVPIVNNLITVWTPVPGIMVQVF
jgi:hypothetical protein